MGGYLSSRKLVNVKGRIKYMTDEKKQENILDYYNTTDNEFWDMLAKESRERHKETKAGGKCCEARELIIGIPLDSNVSAKNICDTFKKRYGVECTCAIHYNEKEKVKNKHCHLIFSEREKLIIPKITEEKRALRTYYYDSKGHKCKKSEAVKIVKKGTVLQKGTTRYFSDKNEHFKSQKFVYECKEMILKDLLKIDWSLFAEKQNKGLSEKHIGKNNPKAKYIKQNNRLKSMLKKVCNASDFIFEQEKGNSFKSFKKNYGVESVSTVDFEENEDKVYRFILETQTKYKNIVQEDVKQHNKTNREIRYLQDNSGNYVIRKLQEGIIDDYEEQTKTRDKSKITDLLKEKIYNMFERIKRLVFLQKDLYIESENRIEIYQDKRNNDLRIEDKSYHKEQKQAKMNNEYDLRVLVLTEFT